MFSKKIYDRKVKLNYENTLIVGPRGVGKTFLIFNFLKEFSGSYKIIDFDDYREKSFDFQEDLIILENYDFSIPIPEDKVVFVTSREDIEIDGFKKVVLGGLDFEEFYSFDNSMSITHSFDKFLKNGNFPRTIFLDDFFKDDYLRCVFDTLPYEKEVLRFFFSHIGEKFTLYQIYQILKKEIKISKDKFYALTNELIKNRILFEVPKYNSPKSPKKFFAYNFAFKNILTNRKNILFTFENIILLELKENVFYKDNLSFYLPEKNLGIMVLPFASEEVLEEKLQKVSGVDKIEVITISNEFEFESKKFEVEVIPFWRWRFAE
jgi:predicted AAA+ superfamily ATPase